MIGGSRLDGRIAAMSVSALKYRKPYISRLLNDSCICILFYNDIVRSKFLLWENRVACDLFTLVYGEGVGVEGKDLSLLSHPKDCMVIAEFRPELQRFKLLGMFTIRWRSQSWFLLILSHSFKLCMT